MKWRETDMTLVRTLRAGGEEVSNLHACDESCYCALLRRTRNCDCGDQKARAITHTEYKMGIG